MLRPLALLLITLAFSPLAISQQPADPDWSAPYAAALKANFTLTQLTPDNLSVATPGTPVVLQRDGLVLWAQVRKRIFTQANKYSNGAIDPGQSQEVLARWEQAGQARRFRAGESFWLTDFTFDRKGNEITLHFLSDPYNGVRYVGSLRFPFAKGSDPTPDQFLSTVAEVLEPGAAPAPAANSASTANSAAAGPGTGFMVLDGVRMAEATSTNIGEQLSLLWMRADPSLFERDKTAWRKFIDINNSCWNSRNAQERHQQEAAKQALADEFQYPSILAFYKSKAPEVLGLVPDKVMVALDVYPGARGVPAKLLLGQYDMGAKAFPFVNEQGAKVSLISLSYATIFPNAGCGNPLNIGRFNIVFPALEFSEIHMEEGAARAYVAGLQGAPGRYVDVVLELQVLPDAPKVETPTRPQQSIEQTMMNAGNLGPDLRPIVTFSARLTKATAYSFGSGRIHGPPLAVLYP